jgi:hypothetical protein
VEQILSMGFHTNKRGKEVGKRCRRVNIVQIMCTHVCNGKMIPVETVPGMGGGEDKGKW